MKECMKFGGQLLAVVLLYVFVWTPFAVAFGVQWIVRRFNGKQSAASVVA